MGEYARPVPPKVNAHSMSNIHGLLNDFSTHPAESEGAPLRGGRTGAPADETNAPESAIGPVRAGGRGTKVESRHHAATLEAARRNVDLEPAQGRT